VPLARRVKLYLKYIHVANALRAAITHGFSQSEPTERTAAALSGTGDGRIKFF
jgi:hypothetical protein